MLELSSKLTFSLVFEPCKPKENLKNYFFSKIRAKFFSADDDLNLVQLRVQCTVSISWKLIVVPKNLSHDDKTTFKVFYKFLLQVHKFTKKSHFLDKAKTQKPVLVAKNISPQNIKTPFKKIWLEFLTHQSI